MPLFKPPDLLIFEILVLTLLLFQLLNSHGRTHVSREGEHERGLICLTALASHSFLPPCAALTIQA